MHDSPQGRAIVERKADAVAWIGLRLEPLPDAGVLGISQQEAAEWSKDVASRFDLWASDKKQHRSEGMTFYQSDWQHAFWKERDNDIFTRLYYNTKDKDLQNPLQFEFIDPDQIHGDTCTTSVGRQHNEHDGIERDSRGREKSYKVWVKDENGHYKPVIVQRKGSRSKRIFMLHSFRPEYAGQGRGFTRLAPIIQDLENATDFSASHIKQAINQANIVGWIVPSKDEDAIPVFDEEELSNPDGSSTDATDQSDGDDPEFGVDGDFDCHQMAEKTFNTPGSAWLQSLTKGADIKLANPATPSAQYHNFMESFLMDLSAATGTPLEVVRMKFGNNFSASRATLLLFQRIVEIEREDMVADRNGPVYEMWLEGEIAAGRVSAPGWSDPRLRKAWLKAAWQGTPVPDIDPKKLADAYEKHITMGTDSAERISQTHSGKSASDNIGLNNESYKDYQTLPFSVTESADDVEDGDKED
jgi:lambda family phage portal protein